MRTFVFGSWPARRRIFHYDEELFFLGACSTISDSRRGIPVNQRFEVRAPTQPIDS